MSSRRVLDSLLQSASSATGAAHGWILGVRDDELVVLAATGTAATTLVGQSVAASAGTAGWVLSTGQPAALQPRASDAFATEGVAALAGIGITTVLSIPCGGTDGIVGVIELVDKADGRFGFEDVELLTLLADVAAAGIEAGETEAPLPSPDQLAAGLRRIHDVDLVRYAHLARVVDELLR